MLSGKNPRHLALAVVLFAFGCGGPSGVATPNDGGNSDAGDGAINTVGAGCSDPLRIHSEGSESSPVAILLASTPYAGGLNPHDGASFYHISALQVGARYLVTITGTGVQLSVFQSGFAGTAACSAESLSNPTVCKVVPQGDSLDIKV